MALIEKIVWEYLWGIPLVLMIQSNKSDCS